MSLISGSFLVVKDLRFFSPGFQYYDLNKTHAYKQVISDPLVTSSKYSFQHLCFALNMFSNTCFLFLFFLLVSSLSLLQCCLLRGTSESIYFNFFTVTSSFIPLTLSLRSLQVFGLCLQSQKTRSRVKASVSWWVSGSTAWLWSGRRGKYQTPPAPSASIHQLLPFLHRDTREKEISPSCKKYIWVFFMKSLLIHSILSSVEKR